MWPIALNMRTSLEVSKSVLWDRKASIRRKGGDDFYILNTNYTTMFRTLYPASRLEKLGQAARQGLVNGDKRAGLVADTCALAQAGYHRVSTCLDFIMSLEEEDQVPWEAISLSFSNLLTTWADEDDILVALKSRYGKLAGDVSRRIGWDFSSGSDINQQQFRIAMFREAAKAGDPGIVRVAKDLFRKFVDDGEDIEEVVQRQVFSTALYYGGEKEASLILLTDFGMGDDGRLTSEQYEAILHYANAATSESKRENALRALLDTEDMTLIRRTLDAMIAGAYNPVDMFSVLLGVGHSRNARRAVWSWARRHWAQLKPTMPTGLKYEPSLVVAATRYMTTRDELRELEIFMKENNIEGLENEFALSVERLRGVVASVKRDSAGLRSWLGIDGSLEL